MIYKIDGNMFVKINLRVYDENMLREYYVISGVGPMVGLSFHVFRDYRWMKHVTIVSKLLNCMYQIYLILLLKIYKKTPQNM